MNKELESAMHEPSHPRAYGFNFTEMVEQFPRGSHGGWQWQRGLGESVRNRHVKPNTSNGDNEVLGSSHPLQVVLVGEFYQTGGVHYRVFWVSKAISVRWQNSRNAFKKRHDETEELENPIKFGHF